MVIISGSWWAFVLRGIFSIIFGVLCFFMPGLALVTLVFMFGFYAIADGVFNIVGAFSGGSIQTQPWWALLLEGIVSLAAGAMAFFMPGITALALLFLIAAWAVVTGGLEIAAAIRLRKQITGEWLLALAGVVSIIFGAFLFIFPGPGALAMVLWIGAYSTVFGIMLVALGIKLRSWARRVVAELTEHHDLPPGVAHGL
jgi:uncharacterized membrane protein HdeD (DUF308 family)